jgi:AdoMet-dependent heme synthase
MTGDQDAALVLHQDTAFRAEPFGAVVYDRNRMRRLGANRLGFEVLSNAARDPALTAIIGALRTRYPSVPVEVLRHDVQRFGSQLSAAGMLTRDSARHFGEADDSPGGSLPLNWGLRAPLIVEIAVLFTCNLRCSHCYTSSTNEHRPGTLTRAELNQIFRDSAQAGVFDVCLTGGEALLRADIIDLVRDAKKWPLFVNLNTNGTPVTVARATALRDSGLDQARVSIDSADPELHDRFRGREGALRATRRGVERLVAAGIPVHIHATLSSHAGHTIAGAEQIISLAKELGAARISFGAIKNVGRALGQSLKASDRQLDEVIEHIRTRMKTDTFISGLPHTGSRQGLPGLPGYDGCGNCLTSISTYVGYEGSVFPCTMMYQPQWSVGSVRESSVIDLWRGSPKLAELRTRAYSGAAEAARSAD